MKNNLINNQDKHKKIIMLHSSYWISSASQT